MLHEPKFQILAGVLVAVFAGGLALIWPKKSRTIGAAMMIVSLFGLLLMFVYWPESSAEHSVSTHGGPYPPDMIYRCEFQNLSDSPFLSVSLKFETEFRKALPTGSGPTELSAEAVVNIRTLDVKQTFSLYIVNQSHDWAVVYFPTVATVRLLGETESRAIPVTRHAISVIDAVPATEQGRALGGGSCALVLKNFLAPGFLQGGELQGGVLVLGRDAGIAIFHASNLKHQT
jgi:hypothetical protein